MPKSRRATLSHRDERAEFEAHKDKATAPKNLGTFGELLMKSQSGRAKR